MGRATPTGLLAILACGGGAVTLGEGLRPPTTLTPSPVAAPNHPAYTSGFIHDAAIVYQNGAEHAENVELHVLDSGRILLAFRGGGTGQAETPDARIRVFSFDPSSYRGSLLSEVAAAPATPPRGIRDPKLFAWEGKLKLSAISRKAGFPIRDLASNARTVVAESGDGGVTFSSPVAAAFRDTDEPTFGIWRYALRRHDVRGQPAETLYATGYNDGNLEAAYFVSDDGGASFRKRGSILNRPVDVPSEAELIFLGPDQGTAVALVRLDNKGLLSSGQTAVCTNRAGPQGFSGDFECGRRLERRLDGPSRVFEVDGRRFVAARKHLACTRKRTALYEVRGDLADPRAPVSLCEIAELPSTGDTAYAAVAPIPGRAREYVLAWYSSPLDSDMPWLLAQFAPSWILAARLDFNKYDPSLCVPPPPVAPCPPARRPPSKRFDLDGTYVLSLAPSFFPAVPAFFLARARIADERLSLTLQGLDHQRWMGGGERVPIGDPFSASGPIGADGAFALDFGNPAVPFALFPIGVDVPGQFVFEHMKVTGVTTSVDGFCGGIEGDVVLSPIPGLLPPGTRLLLEGSTFGASRSGGSRACP